eukprot:TRINITY_DN9584_c0_g2_i1.p1 TRINITY_DN9584_c0_g2~~TRINITY_DN9584_c0_g2_i1.p1  ORF type:complete len:688 (+),score=267.78 TRINITY_DN9584_c0_g2_i1:141-2204(+)
MATPARASERARLRAQVSAIRSGLQQKEQQVRRMAERRRSEQPSDAGTDSPSGVADPSIAVGHLRAQQPPSHLGQIMLLPASPEPVRARPLFPASEQPARCTPTESGAAASADHLSLGGASAGSVEPAPEPAPAPQPSPRDVALQQQRDAAGGEVVDTLRGDVRRLEEDKAEMMLLFQAALAESQADARGQVETLREQLEQQAKLLDEVLAKTREEQQAAPSSAQVRGLHEQLGQQARMLDELLSRNRDGEKQESRPPEPHEGLVASDVLQDAPSPDMPTGGVEWVLAVPLPDVLQRCPSFRRNFNACDGGRQAEISVGWARREAWLRPLIARCALLGNFAPLVAGQDAPQPPVQPSRSASAVSVSLLSCSAASPARTATLPHPPRISPSRARADGAGRLPSPTAVRPAQDGDALWQSHLLARVEALETAEREREREVAALREALAKSQLSADAHSAETREVSRQLKEAEKRADAAAARAAELEESAAARDADAKAALAEAAAQQKQQLLLRERVLDCEDRAEGAERRLEDLRLELHAATSAATAAEQRRNSVEAEAARAAQAERRLHQQLVEQQEQMRLQGRELQEAKLRLADAAARSAALSPRRSPAGRRQRAAADMSPPPPPPPQRLSSPPRIPPDRRVQPSPGTPRTPDLNTFAQRLKEVQRRALSGAAAGVSPLRPAAVRRE